LPPPEANSVLFRPAHDQQRDNALAEVLGSCVATARELERILTRAIELAAGWAEKPGPQLRAMIATLVRRITVHINRVDIELSATALHAALEPDRTERAHSEDKPDETVLLSRPVQLLRIGQGKRLLIDAAPRPGYAGNPDPGLVRLLARAHHLKANLRREPGLRLGALASREQLSPSYVALLLRLTFLAPDITRAILEGRHPVGFTAQKLVTHALPLAWPEQRHALGFA
jgi:site-specific DNA recombinase